MLYYIHGYKSSPKSQKGQLLKKTLNVKPIKYRKNKPENLEINSALKRISNAIKKDKKPNLIGSSLGGYLAAETAIKHSKIKKLILINPFFVPPDIDIKEYKGLPDKLFNEIKNSKNLFEQKIPAKIIILLGTKDQTIPVDWTIKFATVQEATIKLFEDDHRFSQNLQKIPEIISDILTENN